MMGMRIVSSNSVSVVVMRIYDTRTGVTVQFCEVPTLFHEIGYSRLGDTKVTHTKDDSGPHSHGLTRVTYTQGGGRRRKWWVRVCVCVCVCVQGRRYSMHHVVHYGKYGVTFPVIYDPYYIFCRYYIIIGAQTEGYRVVKYMNFHIWSRKVVFLYFCILLIDAW